MSKVFEMLGFLDEKVVLTMTLKVKINNNFTVVLPTSTYDHCFRYAHGGMVVTCHLSPVICCEKANGFTFVVLWKKCRFSSQPTTKLKACVISFTVMMSDSASLGKSERLEQYKKGLFPHVITGNPDGENLIFIAGFPDNELSGWAPLIDLLKHKYQIISICLPQVCQIVE